MTAAPDTEVRLVEWDGPTALDVKLLAMPTSSMAGTWSAEVSVVSEGMPRIKARVQAP